MSFRELLTALLADPYQDLCQVVSVSIVRKMPDGRIRVIKNVAVKKLHKGHMVINIEDIEDDLTE
jgi:hypothetical protein